MKIVEREVGQHGTWGTGNWECVLIALAGPNGLMAVRDTPTGNVYLTSGFVPDGARLVIVSEDEGA